MAKEVSLGQLRRGQAIIYREEPHLVVEASHHKMGRGGAVVRCKLKNLKSGAVFDATFQGNESLPAADLSYKKSQFLYRDGQAAYFMDEDYEQFSLPLDTVGQDLVYCKEGTRADVAFWGALPLSIKLPPKVELRVMEAPPAVRGDTANSPAKTVKLETGLELSVPMFVETDDVIRVNTQTGGYVERV